MPALALFYERFGCRVVLGARLAFGACFGARLGSPTCIGGDLAPTLGGRKKNFAQNFFE